MIKAKLNRPYFPKQSLYINSYHYKEWVCFYIFLCINISIVLKCLINFLNTMGWNWTLRIIVIFNSILLQHLENFTMMQIYVSKVYPFSDVKCWNKLVQNLISFYPKVTSYLNIWVMIFGLNFHRYKRFDVNRIIKFHLDVYLSHLQYWLLFA